MNNLFNLDFSRWGIILLFLIPAAINLGIFIYVTFFLSQSKTNYVFGVFVFLVVLWQIANSFMMLSINAETAGLWCKVLWMFFLFVVPFGLLFTLCFLRLDKKVSNSFIFLTQFLPPIIFLFFIVSGLDKNEIIQSERWHWIANPEKGIANSVIYLWVSAESLFVLGLLAHSYIKAKTNDLKRKQTLLLLIGFSVPILWGVIMESILPLLFGMDDIPATALLFTTFSILSLVAIKKYKLLEFSPKHQWDGIVETMNEGLIIVNNKDEVMFANRTFCEQVGYEFEEIKGKVASELFFVDDKKKKETKTIIENRRGGKSNKYEVQMKTKSGEIIWVLISGSPYLDRNKKVIGSIGIQTDITERKKGEEKIIKASRLYSVLSQINQLIVRTTDEEILFKEACNIVVYSGQFNLAWIATVDVDAGKLNLVAECNALTSDIELFTNMTYDANGPTANVLRSGMFRIINDFNKEPIDSMWRKYAEGREFKSGIFLPVTRAGNTIGTFNIFSTEINFFDKEEIALLEEITRDVSFALENIEKEKQRQIAEKKLEHSELRLKQAQAIAHIGNWELDFSTGVVLWSDEACRIYGVSPQNNIQSFDSFISFIHPEDLEFVQKTVKESEESLKDTSFYHRIVRENQEVRHVHSESHFEFNEEGKPIGLYGIAHDVTEQKKAEAEILKLNEELEERVWQRTIDLAKANVQLEQEAKMLQSASKVIEQKNKDITDSLNYAKLIQNTIVHKGETLEKLFPESFILNMPLNIVSGDFVRVDEKNDKVLVALADCTGHGIAGAMMSMIGCALINDIVTYRRKTSPPEILKLLNSSFDNLTNKSLSINNGMDIGFCAIDLMNMEVQYAGAHRPLFIISNNVLTEIKGDNLSIGGDTEIESEFTKHNIKLQKNDTIYMLSDGYTDQFGGVNGKKFSSKRFKETLLLMQHLNMEEQRQFMKTTINDWKGELEQVDDICVLGIKI